MIACCLAADLDTARQAALFGRERRRSITVCESPTKPVKSQPAGGATASRQSRSGPRVTFGPRSSFLSDFMAADYCYTPVSKKPIGWQTNIRKTIITSEIEGRFSVLIIYELGYAFANVAHQPKTVVMGEVVYNVACRADLSTLLVYTEL